MYVLKKWNFRLGKWIFCHEIVPFHKELLVKWFSSKTNVRIGTSSVIAWFGPMWLFNVSESKILRGKDNETCTKLQGVHTY
jgi:hypothetical protein